MRPVARSQYRGKLQYRSSTSASDGAASASPARTAMYARTSGTPSRSQTAALSSSSVSKAATASARLPGSAAAPPGASSGSPATGGGSGAPASSPSRPAETAAASAMYGFAVPSRDLSSMLVDAAAPGRVARSGASLLSQPQQAKAPAHAPGCSRAYEPCGRAACGVCAAQASWGRARQQGAPRTRSSAQTGACARARRRTQSGPQEGARKGMRPGRWASTPPKKETAVSDSAGGAPAPPLSGGAITLSPSCGAQAGGCTRLALINAHGHNSL